MSLRNAMNRKITDKVSTIEMLKDDKVSAHEAAIAGLSDLNVFKICRFLYPHPVWLLQSLYCKWLGGILRFKRPDIAPQ